MLITKQRAMNTLRNTIIKKIITTMRVMIKEHLVKPVKIRKNTSIIIMLTNLVITKEHQVKQVR
jgi:hypothetical protein